MDIAEVRQISSEEKKHVLGGLFSADFSEWIKTQGYRDPTAQLTRCPLNDNLSYRGDLLVLSPSSLYITPGTLDVSLAANRLCLRFSAPAMPIEIFEYGLNSHEPQKMIADKLFLLYNLTSRETKQGSPLLLTPDLNQGIFFQTEKNSTSLEIKVDKQPLELRGGISREEIVSYLSGRVQERIADYEQQCPGLTIEEISKRRGTKVTTIYLQMRDLRMKGIIGKPIGRKNKNYVFPWRDASYMIHKSRTRGEYVKQGDISEMFNITPEQARFLAGEEPKTLYDDVYKRIGQEHPPSKNGNANNRVLIYSLAEELGIDPIKVAALADQERIGPTGDLHIPSVDIEEAERIRKELNANATKS